ncbi:type II toxin-antitoxin system RelE/ParE family toxin [Solirubrobacter taibaiensis]|nr:type II toxin-antitoxin system RelE/ParE family toxin [Solirubrobacter taibaiensis]
MPYNVYFTALAEDWVMSLGDDDYDSIMARIELLEEHGPGLGRPVVGAIRGSRHPNMKELRAGSMRALFAFDPLRQAIMLVGGDKRDGWTGWYERNIPFADDLLDAHLDSLREDSP